jgi:hypothetical protein
MKLGRILEGAGEISLLLSSDELSKLNKSAFPKEASIPSISILSLGIGLPVFIALVVFDSGFSFLKVALVILLSLLSLALSYGLMTLLAGRLAEFERTLDAALAEFEDIDRKFRFFLESFDDDARASFHSMTHSKIATFYVSHQLLQALDERLQAINKVQQQRGALRKTYLLLTEDLRFKVSEDRNAPISNIPIERLNAVVGTLKKELEDALEQVR